MMLSNNEVIVGLGSNIDPDNNIELALDNLIDVFDVIKVSDLVRTKPIGITNQADFINGAVLLKTGFTNEKVKMILKDIENRLGRDRSAPKYGPRTIDLDIVVWNGNVVDPDFYSRDFVRSSVQQLLGRVRE